MGIIHRIGKLLSADIHGLLDVLEDPVDTCKHAIREMEEQVSDMRDANRLREARSDQLREQAQRSVVRTSELEQQLVLCLGEADEVLARVVMKKKLEQEKLLRFVQQQSNTVSKDVTQCAKQIVEYEERIASIREKLACFAMRKPDATLDRDCDESLAVSEDEINLALMKLKGAAAATPSGERI